MSEIVVLDPSEVAADRVELDITGWVNHDGIDWGDAAIEGYMAEAQYGQLAVDFRMPNRQIQIPFILFERDGVSFDAIRSKVQAKAALYQRKGGWLKREISGEPLYADVMSATLRLGGGTLAALGFADADALLTIEALPDFFGDEEELVLEVA